MTYEALEQEGAAEKQQLVSLHQQRIQGGLNAKKRHAMEHYMDVLTEDEPEVGTSTAHNTPSNVLNPWHPNVLVVKQSGWLRDCLNFLYTSSNCI